MTISEVAGQSRLRPSAIRFYERVGVLPPAYRVSGQRRYDTGVLHRLAVIQRARQTGFTLDEIRQLFLGFRGGTPASKRWRQLSQRKLAELESRRQQIQMMQRLLRRIMRSCHCDTLEQCGSAIFRNSVQRPR